MKGKTEDSNVVTIGWVVKKLAEEKELDSSLLLEKVREALEKGYKRFNPDNSLVTEYDPKSGDLYLFDFKEVVSEVTNPNLEIAFAKAQQLNPKIKLGETIKQPVLLSSYSYFAILQVDKTIKRFLNATESDKIYKRFISKKGTILSGRIENIDYRYFSVNIGDIFAFIPKEQQIPHEVLRNGDWIKFYVLDVFHNHHLGQVMGSRIAPEFLAKLFALEVPEVGSGSILIKKIVRNPGIRAKVAVYCSDPSIDPIGSCIGRAGLRVKNITKILSGERIDVFLWNEDQQQFLINACSPSKVVNVQILPNNKAKVMVLATQYSVAVGERETTLALLKKITDLDVEIVVLEEVAEKLNEIPLNGNLSYSDLVKLEVSPEILVKCQKN